MGLRGLVDRFFAGERGVTPGPGPDFVDRHVHSSGKPKYHANCALCYMHAERLIGAAAVKEAAALRVQVQLAEQRADEAHRLAGMEGPHVVQNVPPIMVGGKGIAWQDHEPEPHTIIGSIEIDEYGEPYFVEGEPRG